MPGRFKTDKNTVSDLRTALMWTRDAAIEDFPMTWKEAFDFTGSLNARQFAGHADWRLPNRRELFSLVSQSLINPALPADHPFENVFPGYYWTASTCARLPEQAWYIHMGGARVYRGMKYASYMVWPVRTPNSSGSRIFQTGQKKCFDEKGRRQDCKKTLQVESIHAGVPWPDPRFDEHGKAVTDKMTGLTWMASADGYGAAIDWHQAFEIIEQINSHAVEGFTDWRMPKIRELESLVDLGEHSPALPADNMFENIREFYWSATTSTYELRYAWALYLKDGSLGVGFKANPEFFLWPVRGNFETLNS